MFRETKHGPITTYEISCDAWRSRGVRCKTTASISVSKQFDGKRMLHDMGWRLMRGHQVCSGCLAKGSAKVTFPRNAALLTRALDGPQEDAK